VTAFQATLRRALLTQVTFAVSDEGLRFECARNAKLNYTIPSSLKATWTFCSSEFCALAHYIESMCTLHRPRKLSCKHCDKFLSGERNSSHIVEKCVLANTAVLGSILRGFVMNTLSDYS